MTPTENLYHYRAKVVSVYDGDTIRVDIDLGFGTWLHNQPLRLYGINAPEIRGPQRPEGLKTRDWLRERLPEGTPIILESYKDRTGKYGRWLATIWSEGENLNELMVELGLAEVYGK